MLKWIVATALVAVLSGAVLVQAQAVDCAADLPSKGTPDNPIRLAYVTDVGQLFDQSFNEGIFNGENEAAEMLQAMDKTVVWGLDEGTVIITPPEAGNDQTFIEEFSSFARNDFDIVVGTGFLSANALREVGRQFPEVCFIGIDHDQPADVLPNVQGILYEEDKAAFLVGLVAAKLSQSGVIGGVYGLSVPAVVRLREGYEAGARFVNPDIRVLGAFSDASPQPFNDPAFGASTAASFIDQGADIIFGAGGITGNGGIQEACRRGVKVIGVDQDQFNTLPEVRSCIVTSALKDITPDTRDAIMRAVLEGEFQGGDFLGKVGVAPFHEFEDDISQDIRDMLAMALAGLEDGSIQTGTTVPAEINN